MTRGSGGRVWSYDATADAAYIRVADRPVVRTAELSPQVILDLDADGQVVGVEIISLSWLMRQYQDATS